MEFFEKLGKVANKTCKYTTGQTNRLATITKLKWKMSEYKSKIDDLYEELGKIVCENNVREEMDDYEERKDKHCKEIDELATKIESCRKKILKLNNKKQCPKCYTEIYEVFKYCPNCGESQVSICKEENEKEDISKSEIDEQIDLDSYVDIENKTDIEEDDIEESEDKE